VNKANVCEPIDMLSTLIKTSKSDKRLYKHITLPNKLQVILISDAEADKSAAALDVHVGAAFDPKPLYGTAHFLEHMLFMGTEKYPSENEYTEFIKNNGGMNNAYTSLTNTNYHFDCANEAFEGALDRFSQFFLNPLLGESQAEREMKAVDSEYNQSLQSDAWKFFSLV
jgi:insulysin